MADPPKGLYVLGALPADDLPSVAIVGSRMCSPYGRKMAYQFGLELAARGVQIVSGMALGIDGYAHEGALAGGGRTLAVLGSGADVCYPEKNRHLYRDIPKRGGVLSEEEPGTPPLPYNFPKRNRIISALSDLVLVVEARKKSGSLITADSALEQGRTVMAVPGRVGDALAEGTNYLIAQGADIAWSVEAVLDALLPLHHRQLSLANALNKEASTQVEPVQLRLPVDGGESETSLLSSAAPRIPVKNLHSTPEHEGLSLLSQKILPLLDSDGKTFDELAEILSANPSELSSALLELRLLGLVEEAPGGRYFLR